MSRPRAVTIKAESHTKITLNGRCSYETVFIQWPIAYQKRVKNKYKVNKVYNKEIGVDQEKERNDNSVCSFIHWMIYWIPIALNTPNAKWSKKWSPDEEERSQQIDYSRCSCVNTHILHPNSNIMVSEPCSHIISLGPSDKNQAGNTWEYKVRKVEFLPNLPLVRMRIEIWALLFCNTPYVCRKLKGSK